MDDDARLASRFPMNFRCHHQKVTQILFYTHLTMTCKQTNKKSHRLCIMTFRDEVLLEGNICPIFYVVDCNGNAVEIAVSNMQ